MCMHPRIRDLLRTKHSTSSCAIFCAKDACSCCVARSRSDSAVNCAAMASNSRFWAATAAWASAVMRVTRDFCSSFACANVAENCRSRSLRFSSTRANRRCSLWFLIVSISWAEARDLSFCRTWSSSRKSVCRNSNKSCSCFYSRHQNVWNISHMCPYPPHLDPLESSCPHHHPHHHGRMRCSHRYDSISIYIYIYIYISISISR